MILKGGVGWPQAHKGRRKGKATVGMGGGVRLRFKGHNRRPGEVNPYHNNNKTTLNPQSSPPRYVSLLMNVIIISFLLSLLTWMLISLRW